ncbi:unnamed protein product [Calypogeia fissa]
MSASADVKREFRENFAREFVKVCTGGESTGMRLLMDDASPRFVWQDVLLSFQRWYAKIPQPEREPPSKGNEVFEKLQQFITAYRDIFHRELLRDYVHLKEGQEAARFNGTLHAAVLWPKTKLEDALVKSSTHTPTTVFESISSNRPKTYTFDLIRRARLWRIRSQTVQEYNNVDKLMREVAALIQKQVMAGKQAELSSLKKVINAPNANNMFTWEVILVWAAVSTRHSHILDEFESSDKDAFREICKSLRKDHRLLAQILEKRDREENLAWTNNVLNLLVNRNEVEIDNLVFLDLLSERTPGNLWSPLHFAAVHGEIGMVKFLIESCDECLTSLNDAQKDTYIKNLRGSFYDARYLTPLHYAVLRNDQNIVAALVNWKPFKPHVHDCDIFMRTAFQVACSEKKRFPIAKEIIKCGGADIDTEDCCSFTALHWAVHLGCEGISKHLIEKEVTPGEVGLVSIIKNHAKKDLQQKLLNLSPVKEEIQGLYRDRQLYIDAVNAILVGAALIASGTFGGSLGINHNEDTAADLVFWASINLSFFFALGSVVAAANTVLPVGYANMADAVEKIRNGLLATSFLLILSATTFLVAFGAAAFAALWEVPDLKTNTIITTSIGGVVPFIVGVVFCCRLFSILPFQEVLEWLKNIPGRIQRKTQSLYQRCCCQVKPQSPDDIYKDLSDHTGKAKFQIALKKVYQIQSAQDGNFSRASREGLRKQWNKHHRREGANSVCPIRDCYLKLEESCLKDISMLEDIVEEAEFREYSQMWEDIKQRLHREAGQGKVEAEEVVEDQKEAEEKEKLEDEAEGEEETCISTCIRCCCARYPKP